MAKLERSAKTRLTTTTLADDAGPSFGHGSGAFGVTLRGDKHNFTLRLTEAELFNMLLSMRVMMIGQRMSPDEWGQWVKLTRKLLDQQPKAET